jgi:tRNA (guanine37-N1)-methyltransferase
VDIHILTLFPHLFQEVLSDSILKRAQEKQILRLFFHNFREFSTHKHHKVDDRPYGGGPGMVLSCEPIFRAVESIRERDPQPHRLILLSPQGKLYHQKWAFELAQERSLILICGHYEGFDERISLGLQPEELSIGNYILTGGEIPALVVIDSVVRLIPGVLGDPESFQQESFSQEHLDHPQYTRPEEFRGMRVPEVLLNGNHKEIEKWRKTQALLQTQLRRPDLTIPDFKDGKD